jgi:hypothetical protein
MLATSGSTVPLDTILLCRTDFEPYPGTAGWQSGRVVGLLYTRGKHYNQMAVCHEVGHVLGLSHQEPGTASCMADGGGHRFPDAHDLETVLVNHSY